MNIWILTSEFPPHVGGGIGTYAHNAACMFSRTGHEVAVLTQGAQPSDSLEAERLRVVRFVPRRVHLDEYVPPGTSPDEHPGFPFACLSYWPALTYQFADEVVQAIESHGPPDVIEVQDYNALGYYLIQRKLLGDPLLADVPVMLHIHSPSFGVRWANKSPQYILPDYWVGQMEKFCILGADSLLSPSRFMRHWLSASDSRFPAPTVVPLPYNHREQPSSEPVPGDVVYVGRLEVRKGVIPMVESCARLLDKGHNFRLSLIGEDRRYDPLGMSLGQYLKRRFARHVAAGRLVFVGPLPREKLLTRLSEAWCTVVPSLWENYPYVCVEGMSLGKVVLASSSGGQAEMVGHDGSAGLVFDWSQQGDFERALLKVLAMTPAEIQAMGQHAADRIRRLTSYEAVLPQRLAHFHEILEQAPKSRRVFPTVSPPQPAPAELTKGEDSIPGLLSVIIPYHNLGEYIEATLDSVLRSTYPDVEVLIVDDGSDEAESIEALERVKALGKESVTILRTENRGVCGVRNMGAAKTSGEFLSFVDADDLVEPQLFSRCIDVLNTYENVGFAYPWISYFGQITGCWASWNTEFPFFLTHNMVGPLAVTRRDLFLAYGQNRPDMLYNLEDYDGWLGIATKGYLGVSIPEILGHYRVRSESRLRSINRDQELHLYERIVQHHAEAYQRYSTELFHLLNANGPARGLTSPASKPEAALLELALESAKKSRLWRAGRRVAVSRLGLRIRQWLRRVALASALGRYP